LGIWDSGCILFVSFIQLVFMLQVAPACRNRVWVKVRLNGAVETMKAGPQG
jgi:hypothetical protein